MAGAHAMLDDAMSPRSPSFCCLMPASWLHHAMPHCMPELRLLTHRLLSRLQCPIMARKFSKETAATIAALLAECGNHLNIVTSAKCEQFRRLLHVL